MKKITLISLVIIITSYSFPLLAVTYFVDPQFLKDHPGAKVIIDPPRNFKTSAYINSYSEDARFVYDKNMLTLKTLKTNIVFWTIDASALCNADDISSLVETTRGGAVLRFFNGKNALVDNAGKIDCTYAN